MKTNIFYIILLMTSCGAPTSPPPDKEATHINPQIDFFVERSKPYYDIQTALKHVDSVKILTLIGTKFNQFPLDIFKLYNLEELDLTDCGLDSIPEQIGELKHLKTLSLRSNKLRKLPKRLFELSQLEVLDNFGNEINDLPLDINKLSSLKELNVSFNNLKSLPDLTGLDNLRNLGCDGNFLTSIPTSVCTLKKLRRLSFLRNKISKIDNCISELTLLKNLVLEQNNLSVSEIKKLKEQLPNCVINTDRQN